MVNAKRESVDIKDLCEKTNISIPIGISGETGNFVLDARFNIGLSNLSKDKNFKQRSDLFMITIGYKFEL